MVFLCMEDFAKHPQPCVAQWEPSSHYITVFSRGRGRRGETRRGKMKRREEKKKGNENDKIR